MEEKVLSQPKNLLVYFYEPGGRCLSSSVLKYNVIEERMESCPQLVHEHVFQRAKPSIARKLAYHAGLTPNKSAPLDGSLVVSAVVEAYEFVAEYYTSGDQVIILSDSMDDPETIISAVELLVTCLTNGTLSRLLQNPRGSNPKKPIVKIPVKGVVAGYHSSSLAKHQNVNVLSDRLLQRLPMLVEHLISWFDPISDNPFSYRTKFSPTGQIISKEVRFYEGVIEQFMVLIPASKDLILYRPRYIPSWDKLTPIWTRTYTTECKQMLHNSQYQIIQLGLGKQAFPQEQGDRPTGMYHHQLALYRWAGDDWGVNSCVVWKSYCN